MTTATTAPLGETAQILGVRHRLHNGFDLIEMSNRGIARSELIKLAEYLAISPGQLIRLLPIAKTRYIDDLSGAGARVNGGRWTRVGVGLLYTSPSRALATVDYLVHVPLARVPKNLSIATIAVPDDAPAEAITEEMLPNNWRQHPAPVELEEIGTRWTEERRSLLLRVPSAVVKAAATRPTPTQPWSAAGSSAPSTTTSCSTASGMTSSP